MRCTILKSLLHHVGIIEMSGIKYLTFPISRIPLMGALKEVGSEISQMDALSPLEATCCLLFHVLLPSGFL